MKSGGGGANRVLAPLLSEWGGAWPPLAPLFLQQCSIRILPCPIAVEPLVVRGIAANAACLLLPSSVVKLNKTLAVDSNSTTATLKPSGAWVKNCRHAYKELFSNTDHYVINIFVIYITVQKKSLLFQVSQCGHLFPYSQRHQVPEQTEGSAAVPPGTGGQN